MITILPAIDLINGKCVRLTKGDYSTEKVYDQDPVAVAQSFQQKGATHLHIVDLDAARGLIDKNLETISKIIDNTDLIIEVGGGIRTLDQVESLLKLGAQRVIIGSLAQKEKNKVTEWIGKVGAEHIVIGADVSNGFISIYGWQEESNDTIEDFLTYYVDAGAVHFLCTDVSKDGMLEGPAVDLYQQLLKEFIGINLIASGGVSNMEDILALNDLGMNEVIVGKAIYEKRVDLEEAIKYLQAC